jgi:hypothetical protein
MRAWRRISQTIQGLVQLSVPGFELWSMNDAGHQLRQAESRLCPGHGYCLACAAAGRDSVIPNLTVTTFDADQAFEAIDSDDVVIGFRIACGRFRQTFTDDWISIDLSPKPSVHPGVRQFARGRWNFTTSQLALSLWCGLRFQFSALGNVILQQLGQSIGGVMSKAALSIVTNVLEFLWRTSPAHRHHCGFPFDLNTLSILRYVDDIIVLTRCFCSACLIDSINGIYQRKFVFGLQAHGFTANWIDLNIDISRSGVFLFHIRAPNLPWVLDPPSCDRAKVTLLPFLGRPPAPLGHLSAVLASRLIRATALGLDPSEGVRRAIVDIIEFHLLGYPFSVIRAIVHLVPQNRPGALVLRRVVRNLRTLWN